MKSTNNAISLIKNGDAFISENLRLINLARNFIVLQTYIFEEDEITKPIINALIEKANSGIDVYIKTDGFGSKEIKSFSQHPKIYYQFLSPLSQTAFKHVGRRLHSKVLIIDNQ